MGNKRKRLLTLEDLAAFCETQGLQSFSAKDTGYELAVQVPATLEFAEDEDLSRKGLKKYIFKVCHTQKNRNHSNISEENMTKALPSLANRPVLCHIHQLNSGEYDFHAHDVEYDEEGNMEYIETQVGSFTEEKPWLEYDEKQDKTYVMAYAVIPDGYTMANDIIARKGGTKVSCELCIENMAYDKELGLDLIDFYFSACTLLGSEKDGTEIGEGMEGSRADIADFSTTNNSVVNNFKQNEEMVNLMTEVKELLSNFNKNNSTEGGNNSVSKFEELLEQYSVTAEDVKFDYENMSNEELEAAFKEAFGEDEEGTPSEDDSESKDEGDGEGEDSSVTETEACGSKKKKKKCSAEEPTIKYSEVKFELSHDDIRYGLYNLLSSYEEADNDYYYINSVYDDHFVYQSWTTGKYYGQKYSKEGDAVSFTEERYELFAEMLTASEKASLEEMRANYAALEQKVADYEANSVKAEKEAILNSEDYADLAEDEKFAELKKNIDKYSVEELKDKAEICFAAHVREAGKYEGKKATFTRVAGSTTPADDYRPYGNAVNHPAKRN